MAIHAPFAPALADARSRHAVLIIDANTGRIVHESSADEPRYPASLAKLMTLYLVFELIEKGRLSYSTRIRFSANAVAAAPSKLDVEEGTEITLIEAIKALVTKSCNDVAVAVAEHIAGSEARFAVMMTRKARELGMTHSVFRNASGLPDPEQVTTARDMMTLALHLHDDFPRHYRLFATRTFTYQGKTYRNHNSMLFNYKGTEGLKTGYTRASGFNLVASVKRGQKHVMGVVFGGATAALRNSAMRTYLNMALIKGSNRKTRRPATPQVARSNTPATPPEPRPAQRPQAQAPGPRVEVARVRPVLVPGAQAGSDHLAQRGDGIAALLARTPPPGERGVFAEPPSAMPGPFQIQIGAFQTQAEAERQLASVSQRAGALLGSRAAVTSEYRRGGKVLYRARYAGFEAQGAALDACGRLKRMSIDCMVTRAD